MLTFRSKQEDREHAVHHDDEEDPSPPRRWCAAERLGAALDREPLDAGHDPITAAITGALMMPTVKWSIEIASRSRSRNASGSTPP